MASIKAQIAQRIQQAWDKEFPHKITLIAKALASKAGYDVSYEDTNFLLHYKQEIVFSVDDITETVESCYIEYANKKVFEKKYNKIVRYIPGNWETKFERLFKKACKIYMARKTSKKRKQNPANEKRMQNEDKVFETIGAYNTSSFFIPISC